MKRYMCLILAVMLVFSLCACGSDNGSKSLNQGSKTVNDVLDEQMNKGNGDTPKQDNASQINTVKSGDVDIDLTAMNSTMVYSEVYNMVTDPGSYLGKTVKMRGNFRMYHDETTDAYYFACIIADATACCSQGIEFVLAGEHTYPDDYPALDSEITVVGTFSTYTEGEYQYCTLLDAQFTE